MNIYEMLEGFTKAGKIKDWKMWIDILPKTKGIYAVIRENTSVPNFINPGTGVFFKNENPNVEIIELQKKWYNSNNKIMYIGRANYDIGHPREQACESTIQKRVKQYMKFGNGQKVGHYGGRYIWQLADAGELDVWYRSCDNPQTTEQELISKYRPFANLI